jgi:predicted GNAT family N-acyltransferase
LYVFVRLLFYLVGFKTAFMPLRIIDHGSTEYQQMVALRQVILRAPLGLSFTEEELAAEKNDILLGFFDDEELEGCCILTKTNDTTVRLRQMAVLAGLQGKGIGRAIMDYAEMVAKEAGYKKLTMHARKTAVGFYEKLDYTICSDEFLEVTIPHVEMEKLLL